MKVYFFTLLMINLVLVTGKSSAQYENIWAFGTRSGLDFNNSGSLPAFYPTGIVSPIGGSASVCDASGQLLFYTEGDIVWDRNGNRMPGTMAYGQGLTGLPQDTIWGGPGIVLTSTPGAQSSMIVPIPNHQGKYYVFSLTFDVFSALSNVGSKLYYSVIDMSLNSGLGDVVAGQKGILLDSNLCAKMTGVMGDQCNIWVTVLPNDPPGGGVKFKSYRITESGIDPIPVISSTGVLNIQFPPMSSEIKFSKNRKRLAVSWANPWQYPAFELGGLAVFDFDPNTGLFSNQIVLAPNYDRVFFGVEFSDDNSKLYTSCSDGGPGNSQGRGIYQYDLNGNNATAIIGSEVLLDSLPNSFYAETCLKRGPDGRIYYLPDQFYGYFNGYHIGVVNYPNLSGIACQIDDSAISVPINTNLSIGYYFGLPNVVPILLTDTAYNLVMDTLCFSSAGNGLALQSPLDNAQYLWNDGSTGPSYTAMDSGIYWVRSSNYCHYRIDTFQVGKADISFDLGPSDTTVCDESSLAISVNLRDVNYLWQDGSASSNYIASSTGTYWVMVTSGNCKASDTMEITIKELQVDLGADIILCKGEPISVTLKVQAPPGSVVNWSEDGSGNTITVVDTGLYWVKVDDLPCLGTDSIHIGVDPFCDCVLQVPNAFSPNGDGQNDYFKPLVEADCPVRNFSLKIYNRFGQLVYSGVSIEKGWDGKQNGLLADVGTYFFEIKFEGGTQAKQFSRRGDLVLLR